MVDTNAGSIILHGMPGSLYTAKVRSYLRKQGIACEEPTPGKKAASASAMAPTPT